MLYGDNVHVNYQAQQLQDKEYSDFEYFVIDDLLDDPLKVRNRMLNFEYETPPSTQADGGSVHFIVL